MAYDVDTQDAPSLPGAPVSWFARLRLGPPLLIALALITAIVVASAWLAVPYFVEGRGLLAEVGGSVQEGRRAKADTIGQFLSRWAVGPGEAEVEVLFATPTYFEIADKARHVSEYRPDRYVVFIVNETTHIADLPAELPEAQLFVDGRVFTPFDVEGPLDVVHHRSVTIRFDAFDQAGNPIIGEGTRDVRLTLHGAWDPDRSTREASWSHPIDYPEELLSGETWSPAMVLALSAGLLSFVLTPCLLQLIVIYVMTLTGLSAEEATRVADAPGAHGRKIFYAALSFVAGFALLFTAAGAGAGYAGKEMQLFFAEWSRSVSIVAGVLVIALGIWVGIRSRAPLICRLPGARLVGAVDKRGYFSSALMAVGFSLGCITCFGGAIIATLLVYVGTLGSPAIGAGIMLTFALGVGVPFLLAALFLSRAMPLIARLSTYAPYLGFASMTVIIAFGSVLVTDNFHVFSGMLYPYLEVLR